MRGLNTKYVFLGLFYSTLFSSCGGGDLIPTNIVLPEYHKMNNVIEESKIVKGKYSIYYDLSDGMKYAYQNNTLRDYLSDITNGINGSWDVYGLVTGKIDPIRERGGELYQKVMAEPYTDIKAPIEESMKDIVRNQRPSLIVSDLEEYQTINGRTEIQHRQAYAKNYFSQWLRMGGQIYFFVMDYKEPIVKSASVMKDKHLFFVAFDNAEGDVREFVEKAIAIRPKSYRTFNLSSNTYSISTEYAKATQGGNYHDSKGEDIVSDVNEDIKKGDCFINSSEFNWEFYPCYVSWKDILKNAKNMQNPEIAKLDQYKHFLSKLFITFEDEDAFKIENLDITVTNIQKDFGSYSNYMNATQCKPSVNVIDGETVVDFSACPKGKDYYDERGNLLSQNEYKKDDGKKVEDMFVVSMNETNEKGKYEICVDFSDRFTGENANVQREDMLRLEITLGNANKGDIRNMEKNFIWQDVDDKNEAIFQSILNTLNDPEINPKGKLVYTYYVRAY